MYWSASSAPASSKRRLPLRPSRTQWPLEARTDLMAAFPSVGPNATSRLGPVASDAMVEARRAGGKPSSVHCAARTARSRVDTARRQVSALAGALPVEIVFTSGGTEANNMAIDGSGRERVLASSVGHD